MAGKYEFDPFTLREGDAEALSQYGVFSSLRIRSERKGSDSTRPSAER